jgi:hypothetical protein
MSISPKPRAARRHTSVSETGDAENISKGYVSRILRLALLAPDIVEAIVGGRTDASLVPKRLERPLPARWEDQRRLLLTQWTLGAIWLSLRSAPRQDLTPPGRIFPHIQWLEAKCQK